MHIKGFPRARLILHLQLPDKFGLFELRNSLTNVVLFVIVPVLVASCSSTIFTGQHTALFPLAPDENVTVLECSGLRISNTIPEELNVLRCDELFLVHIHCINNNFENLSPDCISEFKANLNAGYVVVPRTTYFRPGSMLQTVTDYEATVHPPGLVDETASTGTVSFDIYDTEDGAKINTFDVSVRTRGWGIGNKRDRGYTRVNVVPDDSNLSKARKKGLKNIAGRIVREKPQDSTPQDN